MLKLIQFSGQWKLLVNIDEKHTAFYKEQSLKEFITSMFPNMNKQQQLLKSYEIKKVCLVCLAWCVDTVLQVWNIELEVEHYYIAIHRLTNLKFDFEFLSHVVFIFLTVYFIGSCVFDSVYFNLTIPHDIWRASENLSCSK